MSQTGSLAENPAVPEDARCAGCGCRRDATDRFCRQCGRPFGPMIETAQTAQPLSGPGCDVASGGEQLAHTAQREGQKQGAAVIVAQLVPERHPRTNWLHTRWGVWLLIAALGPVALPWLWRSRGFTRFGKIVVTLLVIVLTVAIVWALGVVVAMLVRNLQGLFQLLQGM